MGAGPTGLVLALWLARLGIRVRIVDKADEPGITSRALAVQVRTLELYGQLGIAEEVVAGGVKIQAINLWVKGERAVRVPFRQLGEGLTPYTFVLIYPQDAHERLLIARLENEGVEVERGVELIRFEDQGDRIRATLRLADGREERCESVYLAGCDGASSTVRESLGIGFPGGTYEGFFYVADVDATGPATEDELHADLEEADFALLYPLKGGGRVRLVGNLRESSGDSQLTFEDVRGRAIANLKLDVRSVNWFSTYRVHHRVASRFRHGRAFLLGDAAHIHSPVGGQGMNTGIGDAVNLAWKLAAVMKGQFPQEILETYELERIRFARRLVATTDRLFTFITRSGSIARFVRRRIVPLLAPWLLGRSFMRRFLFRTVSQVGVRYRDSPLSAGEAGDIRGGDRLPWVETARGEDNFAPLVSMDWQVHVYGDVRAGVPEACAELELPLHRFAWRPEMRSAGFGEDALYLIRPDGYVALADPEADPETLRSHFLGLAGSLLVRTAPEV